MRSPSPEQHSSKRHQCCQLTRLTAITGGGTVIANAASYADAAGLGLSARLLSLRGGGAHPRHIRRGPGRHRLGRIGAGVPRSYPERYRTTAAPAANRERVPDEPTTQVQTASEFADGAPTMHFQTAVRR